MRNPLAVNLLGALFLTFVFSGAAVEAEETSKPMLGVIFDTDLGNDIDDALALAMLHALESRGECRLLAVTVTKDNELAAPAVDAINTFYGRGDIPIGVVRGGATPKEGKFLRALATAEDNGRPRYPHDLLTGRDAPEATGLLRRVLAKEPDGSVAVVMVGFSTNMARLLDSGPDAVSPLSGKELVRRKVRLLSAMAGAFSPELQAKHYREYNVHIDVPSAQKVYDEWPTPIVFSGYEIGIAIPYPARSILDDYGYVAHHPIKEGYERYGKMPYDRPTWDLTSVLVAVRPDRGYFTLSPPGCVRSEADGFTVFEPEKDGPHRHLIASPEQVVRVKEALTLLSSEPPKGK